MPDDLARTIARYAAQHRTSANDALVRLACEGAHRYEQERAVAELAAARRDALDRLLDREAPTAAEPFSDDDATRAILGFRLGLDEGEA